MIRPGHNISCVVSFLKERPKNVGDIFVIFLGENNEKKLYS